MHPSLLPRLLMLGSQEDGWTQALFEGFSGVQTRRPHRKNNRTLTTMGSGKRDAPDSSECRCLILGQLLALHRTMLVGSRRICRAHVPPSCKEAANQSAVSVAAEDLLDVFDKEDAEESRRSEASITGKLLSGEQY